MEASLSFQNVSWVTSSGKSSKVVLHDLCGSIAAGHVNAIMGESGSGKTTLLQILAGQKLPTSGEVSLNGESIDASAKRYIGMVRMDLGSVVVS